jgi:hypothetical protein
LKSTHSWIVRGIELAVEAVPPGIIEPMPGLAVFAGGRRLASE